MSSNNDLEDFINGVVKNVEDHLVPHIVSLLKDKGYDVI